MFGEIRNEPNYVLCILDVSICRPFSFGFRKFGKMGVAFDFIDCEIKRGYKYDITENAIGVEALEAAASLEKLF